MFADSAKSDGLRLGRAVTWLAFYLAVMLAWAAVFAMARTLPDVAGGGLVRPGFWQSLCYSAAEADPLALVAMWGLMAVAMMAPTIVPALRTYADMFHCGAASTAGFAALVGGYLAAWAGFSAMAAGLQAVLSNAGMLAPDGASVSVWLTAGLLVLAGAYQFSSVKAACLAKCRHPVSFFIAHWRPGVAAAAAMGLRLGAVCVGCCWALMGLAFVGGTMNVVWMGLAMVFMALEKLDWPGRVITEPAGIVLVAAGAAAAAHGAGVM